ncbi:MAG: hypothetical protein QXV17_08235 [Candidatus Micrarchaeaceae archaeon]
MIEIKDIDPELLKKIQNIWSDKATLSIFISGLSNNDRTLILEYIAKNIKITPEQFNAIITMFKTYPYNPIFAKALKMAVKQFPIPDDIKNDPSIKELMSKMDIFK